MFRIEVDKRGATYIFCNSTGKLLCIIDDKKYPKHKPVAIGRPIPRQSDEADPDKAQSLPDTTASPAKKQKLEPVDLNPKLTLVDFNKGPKEINKDYSEDCIVEEEFLSTLGLISKKNFNSTPVQELKFKFPYRNIGRVSQPDRSSVPWQTKFYYEVEMCSSLTQKYLSENLLSPKYHMRNSLEMTNALNKNSHYLQSDDNLHTEERNNLPKLRCRDVNLYPLTYKVLKDWKNLSHKYSFTKKQRLERVKVIETGLTKNGRKMSKLCKKVSVKLVKLDPRTIKKHVTHHPPKASLDSTPVCVQAFLCAKPIGAPFLSRANYHPGIAMMIRQPERFVHVSSHFQHPLAEPSILPPRSTISPSALTRRRLNGTFTCKVLLRNVLHSLSQRNDACYVGKSSVSVKNVTVLPLKLWQSSPRIRTINLQPKQITPRTHRPGLTIHRMGNSTPSSASASGVVVRPVRIPPTRKPPYVKTFTKTTNAKPTQDIPLIDITSEDEDDVAKIVPPTPELTTFVFHCYGCNLRMHFKTKEECDNVVYKHMVEYHSVAQPSLFLQRNPLQPATKIFVEAFPGFKNYQ